MTGEELKTFTTSLLDGDEMDEALFYNMVNVVKTIVEGIRPWRKLLTSDSTLFANASDTYTTMKALPADWMQYNQYDSIFLQAVDNDDEIIDLTPSAFSERLKNKNKNGLYYVDVKNSQFGIIASITKQHRIIQNYIAESPEIEAGTEWIFPERYHRLLCYMVSGMQKGGVDYDDIFARMAPENKTQAQAIVATMEMWDDSLQRQESNY